MTDVKKLKSMIFDAIAKVFLLLTMHTFDMHSDVCLDILKRDFAHIFMMDDCIRKTSLYTAWERDG